MLTRTKTLGFSVLLSSMSVICTAQNVPVDEYPLPTVNSVPEAITVGPDGALWFTEGEANKIGRITTAGVVTNEYPVPTANSGPNGITAGPDGALWFTEWVGGKIGRITTAGVIKEYPLSVFSGPNRITVGPDGALWFTESQANNIGRITTTGTISEYAVPTANSFPNGITTRPDGALWFVEESEGGKVGRITTAGVITNEYPVPTANSAPIGITAGPDGALWFTEYVGDRIGRISTAGLITEYPLPVVGSRAWGITAGPGGALWFVELTGNKIGRITTTGSISEYPVPTANSLPNSIIAGPNSTLWFVELIGNKIGRVAAGCQVNVTIEFHQWDPPDPGNALVTSHPANPVLVNGVPQYFGYLPSPNPPPGGLSPTFVLCPTINSGCALTSISTMLTTFNPFTTAASFDTALVSLGTFGYGVATNSHLPGNPYDWCEMNWYFDRLFYPFTIQNVDEQDFLPGGFQLREPDTGSTVTLDQYLDQHVCTDSDRVILKLDESINGTHAGEHFVFVTGKHQNANGSIDWTLFDPGYNPVNVAPPQNFETLQGHENGFYTQTYRTNPPYRTFQPIGVRTYRDISATPSANQGGITFTANSPVELLITDPRGRTLGNVSPGVDTFQIPKGTYVREFPFGDDNGTGAANGDPTGVKTVFVRAPLTGNYQVAATGTALGTYSVIIRRFGADGSAQQTMASGVTNVGAVSKYSYSSSASGTPTVTLIASFQSTLADINNALQLGLIDNTGIANSLLQKIQAAQSATGQARNNILNAFKNEVNAQTGKHLTGIVPQVLLQDADSLISQTL